MKLSDLKIKVFADGADIQSFRNLNSNKFIKGFTTNPSLMKKSGVKDYKKFAKELLNEISDKPISFEVFEDDLNEMERQAREIATWGKNVFVKIPIMNTKGISTHLLVKKLAEDGISCNITAIFTIDQLKLVSDSINNNTPVILSIFAGRIADTGYDPISMIKESVEYTKNKNNIQILWASTREILNIFQADKVNCQIITVPNDLLKKLNNLNKDLETFSKETVIDFYNDAVSAGYKL